MTPDLEPKELITALKQYGYDGVEWRCTRIPEERKEEKPSFWGNHHCTLSPDAADEELEQWLSWTQDAGMEVTSVTPYLQCGDLTSTERVLHIARKLGAKAIRLGVPRYDRTQNYNDLYHQAEQYLSEAVQLCKQYGIKGLIETHHVTIAPSASLAYRLVHRYDPEHIGVLFDPGNMVHEGYENYRMGLELLGPYLAHVHVKNARWVPGVEQEDGTNSWNVEWAPVHQGVVDWKQVLSDLKAVGYDGTIGFEDFSRAYDSREALQRNIQYIRGIWEGL